MTLHVDCIECKHVHGCVDTLATTTEQKRRETVEIQIQTQIHSVCDRFLGYYLVLAPMAPKLHKMFVSFFLSFCLFVRVLLCLVAVGSTWLGVPTFSLTLMIIL